jgi:glycosyltransferase involved in cell wall biosynthesis
MVYKTRADNTSCSGKEAKVGFLCYDLQPFTEDCLYRVSQAIKPIHLKAYPVFFHPNQTNCRVAYRPSNLKGTPIEVKVEGSTPEGFACNINWKCSWDCVHQSDIILLYGLQGATALLAGLYSVLMNKILISVNRTLPVVWEQKRRWWIRFLKKWLLNCCSLHIYQTWMAKEVLTSVYNIDERQLFYAPFEAGAGWFDCILKQKRNCRNEVRRKMGLADEVVFLFVGNLASFKGVDDIINAASLVPGDADFICAFAGPEVPRQKTGIESFRKMARRLGIEQRLRFLGELCPEELAATYWSADVIVLPTHKDCTPKVIVEGTLAYKPIITTNAHSWTGTLVLDGENGFVIKPGDTNALAKAMTKMLDMRLREKMGNKSRKLVKNFCDHEAETSGFVNAINMAMGQYKPCRRQAVCEKILSP